MRLTLCLTVLSAGNVFLSVVFQWCVLTQLGPGIETDALFAGMTVPQLILSVVSGSLMHVLVPLLSGEEEEAFRRNAWGLFTSIAVLFSSAALALHATASLWVPLTVPGFGADAATLTVTLTRIQLIGMVFTALSGVLWGVCHARRQFIRVELILMIGSVSSLGLLVWALPRYGVVAAAWAAVMRVVLQTGLLLPGLGGYRKPDLRSDTVREAWRRITPLLLGTIYYKTDPLVERFLLSMTQTGSLSLYYLAQQIYGAANQVVSKALAAPAVPLLSSHAKSRDADRFHRVYRKRLSIIGIVVIGGWLGLLILGKPILSLLVGYGRIEEPSIHVLWVVMLELGGVLIGGGLGQISSVAFYSRGDTRTTTRLGVYTYTFYLPVKVASFYLFGVTGLAVTTSMFFLSNFALQAYFLDRTPGFAPCGLSGKQGKR